MDIRKHLSRLLRQTPYLLQALGLVWQSAPRHAIAWLALLVAQAGLPLAAIYLIRDLVNYISTAINSDTFTFPTHAMMVLGLLIIVTYLSEWLGSIHNMVWTTLSELVQDHIVSMIHAQSLRLDLSYYESSEYYDQLHRARIDAVSRPVTLLNNMGTLIQNGLTLCGLIAVLLGYIWWLPLALMLGAFPVFGVLIMNTVRFHRWRLKNTIRERRTRYYDMMVSYDRAAAEMRLFNLGDHFINSYTTLRQTIRGEYIGLVKKQMVGEIAASTFATTANGLVFIWMVYQASRKVLSLGDLAALYQIFNQGQKSLRTLLNSMGEVYRNILFLENLFEFLALEPALKDPETAPVMAGELQDSIALENVSFKYPGSDRCSLERFNLIIPKGKIIAIVGENGAGKSTLIKLLCRFYDPFEGVIRYDGADLRALSLESLRRQITVLFQEPARYTETVAENVAFGDYYASPAIENIQEAINAAGADGPVRNLPEGLQTLLGKWFGGSELSVGEWQRISLARAFIRRASLVILDEPTSAMDSWSELDWMKRFRSLSAGRTALIITHRFTTALQADLIHVMVKGGIVESGSHDELVAQDGLYAKSWKRQIESSISKGVFTA